MLFQARFLPGIRSGEVTVTVRAWKSPRVKVGNPYRLGADDVVVVDAVEPAALGDLTARDAERAGFASTDELVEAVKESSRTRLTTRSKVFRVTFHHERSADPRVAKRADASGAAVDEVCEKLERVDARSRRGPWTTEVLQLIADRPRTSAEVLSKSLGRERLPFKAHVRKLKQLGLTVSHDVGYSLSPRGRAVLRRRAGRLRG